MPGVEAACRSHRIYMYLRFCLVHYSTRGVFADKQREAVSAMSKLVPRNGSSYEREPMVRPPMEIYMEVADLDKTYAVFPLANGLRGLQKERNPLQRGHVKDIGSALVYKPIG
jgi:hypothetical protein